MQVRLDKGLVERGLASTRTRAQFMIKSGVVLINQKLVNKTSYLLKKKDDVKIMREVNPWVSRAGLKLEYAIETFKLAPLNGIAMDIGASTGGFSEVVLAYGCSEVYSIDVGRHQLDKKLREDVRVFNMEGVNAKNLLLFDIPQVDLIVCDASFISLKKVIKVPLLFGKDNCQLIVLIKPQFEVGPRNVGKRGIVKDSKNRWEACLSIKSFLDQEGWLVTHLAECPISGDQGNIEFLLAAKKKT